MENKNITRMDFFRKGFWLLFEETKDSHSHHHQGTLRPPGAIGEKDFIKTCTGCKECERMCPHRAIHMKISYSDPTKIYPEIIPELAPCHLCEDVPCVMACKFHALKLENDRKIGIAKIKKNNCYAHKGQRCDYCFDRCPLKKEAIIMQNNLPVIQEYNCTGCGICLYYCPAPDKGIKIITKRLDT